MERRRKALGLKKPITSPEKNAPKPSRRMKICENSESCSEDKMFARGKAADRSQPTCSTTPKQKMPETRHQHQPSESPCSPMQSPRSQIMFPVTFASPEIEVSWDWSCSQVPREMLPPKKSKQVQDAKTQKPVLPAINMCSLRPRHPIQQRMTEEERQQRLEYYKQILSFKSEGSPTNLLDTKNNNNNNNVENMSVDSTKSFTTPKRPTTRLSSASKKKHEDYSLFDDSANEFMLECSQAIEDKLKSGEIDVGPIVDIQISQGKRHHSPSVKNAKLNKKTCHGRVNLFPDQGKPDDTSLNERLDRNCPINSKSDKKLTHNISDRSAPYRSNKNVTIQSQNSSNERLHSRSTFSKQDTVNCLTTLVNGDNSVCEDNQSSLKPPNCSMLSRNSHNDKKQENGRVSCDIEMRRLNSNVIECVNPNTLDNMSSLLDDDFNLELSSLDVDSLCRSSENSQAKCTSEIDTVRKQCTQQEIEAKRLAALQKLKMKRKR